MDEERYDIEAKCLHNTREVSLRWLVTARGDILSGGGPSGPTMAPFCSIREMGLSMIGRQGLPISTGSATSALLSWFCLWRATPGTPVQPSTALWSLPRNFADLTAMEEAGVTNCFTVGSLEFGGLGTLVVSDPYSSAHTPSKVCRALRSVQTAQWEHPGTCLRGEGDRGDQE